MKPLLSCQKTLLKRELSVYTGYLIFLILGADITDYFNYGFTEDTWKQYCERQRRLRMDISGQRKIYVSFKMSSFAIFMNI